MGGLGSGGRNKCHRTIDYYRRLDSFAFRRYVDSCKCLSCEIPRLYMGSSILFDMVAGTVEIRWGERYRPLGLAQILGIDGTPSRLYFLCPHCGRRVRYLYEFHEYFVCRHCLDANYVCQQRNRGMQSVRRRMKKLIEKDLGYTWWRRDNPDCLISELYLIPKPRYMRWAKYEALIQRYRELQDDYIRALLKAGYPFLTPQMRQEWADYL